MSVIPTPTSVRAVRVVRVQVRVKLRVGRVQISLGQGLGERQGRSCG